MVKAGAATALLSTEQMRTADQMTIAAGTPGITLMRRAGEAVAATALGMLEERGRPAGAVAILCGPGNNGGDGFVAAAILAAAGCRVGLFLLGSRDALRGDAAMAAGEWKGPVGDGGSIDLDGVDLVVDAMFGAGLSRPLDGDAARAVDLVNRSAAPVLAVDVPSGIDGDTGEVRGASIRADTAVTFFRAKPGHYLYPGADRRGRLVIADIGIGAAVLDAISAISVLNGPELWLGSYPWPASNGHKYKRGHAVVVSGGASHTGAARMSARAALRVGAGLVTLASPTDAMAANAAHLTAIMLRVSDGSEGLAAILADDRHNAVVLGPGLGVGPATRDLVQAALAAGTGYKEDRGGRACVLDADALTSFAGAPEDLARLVGTGTGPVVVTPHDGEFSRLFSAVPGLVQTSSKLERTRQAAAALGCTVLLKGPDTVIADPSGRTAITFGEAPWLATAGSGDVLSGLIGGLLAQGMPAFLAANASAWLHAAAARRYGPGLIAEDLPEALPAVLADLYAVTSNQDRRPATA